MTVKFLTPLALLVSAASARRGGEALATTRPAGDSEELEAALERERLVAEISRKVRSELDLDKVLRVAVAETGRALGVARCYIRLGEPGEELPVLAEWDAPGVEPIGPSAARLAVTNLAARDRRTVAVPDVAAAPELDDPSVGGRDILLAIGTRAVLATPIVVFGRMIGVFALHRADTGPWSAGEVSLAEAVAGEAGLAIHTARLLAENERRVEEHKALLKAAQTVTSDLRLESVLQRLVEEVTRLLEAEAADCYLYDPDRRLLRCAAVYGLPRELVGTHVRAGQGLTGRALEAGRPVVANDYHRVDSYPAAAYEQFARAIVAPITWMGETKGVLGVGTRDPSRRFDEGDADLLDAFARLAALALHNAESFEERGRQAQVERGFYRVAEVLGSPLSLAETLDALARAACETLGGASALVLAPRGAETLELAGSYRVPPALTRELAGGLSESAGPLLTGVGDGRILASSALAEDERLEESWRGLLTAAGFRSLLTAPVGSREETNVVVVLFATERTFSDDELALVRHLADAARGALERSELFETERRARNLSQRLASVGARLVTTLDPHVVLDEVVREAPALLDADAVALRLLEDDELVVRAAAGPGAEELVGTVGASATGLLGDVAQSRSPFAVEDAASEGSLGDALLERTRSALAVPMIAHGGRLHGVLSVYSRTPRRWREEQHQALVALAAAASAALSNAELYQRVAEEKERSETILANIADGIVAVDRDERIVLWNAAAEQITGVPADEALGRRVPEVLQRELAADRADAARDREVAILRGGTEVWLSLSEAVILDPAGAVAGRVFAFRDVSSERVVEQMKSDFVSAVSHELRTPLTSIYGFAETLLRPGLSFSDRERATFLGYIASESERLIRIVDDLLNVARLEAGVLGLTVADTDVGDVVREVVARAVEQTGGDYAFVVELADEPLHAEADRERLAQVVFNLVDNAVKFSSPGATITIGGRRRIETVEVRVTDEGIGITRSDLHRIFTKFYRAETAPVGVEGTGLGLFLVRGLLTAMGGRIWVESKPGEGSTFVFELPASRRQPAGVEAEETSPS